MTPFLNFLKKSHTPEGEYFYEELEKAGGIVGAKEKTPEFVKAWAKLTQKDPQFVQYQFDAIVNLNVSPVLPTLNALGWDWSLLTAAEKDMLLSGGTQHGAGSWATKKDGKGTGRGLTSLLRRTVDGGGEEIERPEVLHEPSKQTLNNYEKKLGLDAKERDLQIILDDTLLTESERAKLIEQQKDLITQRESLITQQKDLITQQKDLITQQKDLITQRESLITQQGQLKDQKIELLQSKEGADASTLKAIDQKIQAIDEQIQKKTELVGQKTTQIKNKNEQVNKKTEQITQKSKDVNDFRSEIEEKDWVLEQDRSYLKQRAASYQKDGEKFIREFYKTRTEMYPAEANRYKKEMESVLKQYRAEQKAKLAK